MSGCIGGLTGKAGNKTGGSDQVLKIAANQFYKHIKCKENDTVDIFIFSWDTNLHDGYIQSYKPKQIITTDQILFDVKSTHEYERFQSHYSRWYALKEVVKLKNDYENKNGSYNLTILTRLDLYWLRPFDFNRLNLDYFNFNQCEVGGRLYGSKHSMELGDVFIASNSANINKMATIYDHLDEYVATVSMYRGISSHFIIPHHLKKLGIRDQVSFPLMYWYPSFSHRYEDSDCTLVRCRK